jgi:hypothetical protein
MNTCETGRHLQTSWTNCSQHKVLHAVLTVHVHQKSSYGTGSVRATCYVNLTQTCQAHLDPGFVLTALMQLMCSLMINVFI